MTKRKPECMLDCICCLPFVYSCILLVIIILFLLINQRNKDSFHTDFCETDGLNFTRKIHDCDIFYPYNDHYINLNDTSNNFYTNSSNKTGLDIDRWRVCKTFINASKLHHDNSFANWFDTEVSVCDWEGISCETNETSNETYVSSIYLALSFLCAPLNIRYLPNNLKILNLGLAYVEFSWNATLLPSSLEEINLENCEVFGDYTNFEELPNLKYLNVRNFVYGPDGDASTNDWGYIDMLSISKKIHQQFEYIWGPREIVCDALSYCGDDNFVMSNRIDVECYGFRNCYESCGYCQPSTSQIAQLWTPSLVDLTTLFLGMFLDSLHAIDQSRSSRLNFERSAFNCGVLSINCLLFVCDFCLVYTFDSANRLLDFNNCLFDR